MGLATLAFPWESTPLGAMSTWGESLRQIVRMCFSTKFPVVIAWGPELTMIYNDAYRDMLGTHKRLDALGAPFAKVWEEIWDDIGPWVTQVMTTQLPVWQTDAPLTMNRSGYEEETFFTFSYSPIVDDWGQVVGILDIATETTAHVIAQRRLALVDTLHTNLQDAPSTLPDLADAAALTLETSPDVARIAVVVPSGVDSGTTVIGDTALADDVSADTVRQVMTTRSPTVVGSTIVAPLCASDGAEADAVLIVEAAPTRPFDASLRTFVMLVAAALTGAMRSATVQQVQIDYLDARNRILELENARSREASVALQHSLLTAPPEADHLHVVVRYQPSVHDLAVGGDWYDAFLTKDGATTLVIGDVTGHDHHAAATMGQMRGLIRAIAYDSNASPALVLERADEAISGLSLGGGATGTAVLARIEQTTADRLDGLRTLRWTNAGHPHPMIVRADGTVETLNRSNDLLLGVIPDTQRTEHTTTLHPNDTVILYTDGLIERRHTPMAHSTAILLDALRGAQHLTLDDLANHLLHTLAPDRAEDDVALVIVRPYPENRPRPAEAGPGDQDL